MTKKISKIVLPAILFLIFYHSNFQKISAVNFSVNNYPENDGLFVTRAWAKKKPAKKRKRKIKKTSKEKNALAFQNPIAVSGDDICRKNSKEALKILHGKDKENFDLVVSNLGKIECAVSGSGVYPWEDPPRFKVGVATSNAEPVWFASVLVHESCHIGQFEIAAGKNPGSDVPEEEYFGEKAEKECLDIQLGTLKKLGASRSKIEYMMNIADSRYWLTDIGQRWW